MNKQADKQALLDEIQHEADVWESLLNEVGESHMEQPGATDDWTFKDVVGHLSGWRTRTVARLEAAKHDRTPDFSHWPAGLEEANEEDLQKINQWIYQENYTRSLSEILNESRAQFRDLSELVRGLPEDKLFEADRFEWMEGMPVAQVVHDSFGHFHEEHEPVLREWLAKVK